MPNTHTDSDRRPVRIALLLLLAMTAARIVMAAVSPLSGDEAYYWLWTRPLHLSYYDHPGMVAWWIWASVHLFGNTAFAVRLPAILASVAVTGLVADSARLAFASRRAGALAAIWINATLLFGSAAVIMAPDAPLLLFWTLALWAVLHLCAGGGARWLYLVGAALGLGAASKYTMALLLPGLLVAALAFPALRRWWTNPHAWLATLLAAAGVAPVLVWNLENGGASFHKQLAHAFTNKGHGFIEGLGTFIGAQAGLATPLVLVFVVVAMTWALVQGWRRRRAELFLLGATSLPVLLFFAVRAADGRVQAHWPGPSYVAGLVAVAGWMTAAERPRLRPWLIAAPILGVAMTLAVYLQATTALVPLPSAIDSTSRLGGGAELAAAVNEERHAHPGVFLSVEKHEVMAQLTFALADHPTVFLVGGRFRPSQYDAAQVAALKGHDGLFVAPADIDGVAALKGCFQTVRRLREVTLHWGGRPIARYAISLGTNYRGGAFVMGGGLDGPHC